MAEWGVGGLVSRCHIIHVYLSYKYDFNRYSPHLLATNYSNYISIIDNTALYIVHFMTSMQVARIINPKWTDTHNHQGNPNVNNYYFLRVSSIIYITWSRFSCQRNFKKAFLLPSVYFYDVNINVSVLKIFLLFILFPLNLPSCRINGEMNWNVTNSSVVPEYSNQDEQRKNVNWLKIFPRDNSTLNFFVDPMNRPEFLMYWINTADSQNCTDLNSM